MLMTTRNTTYNKDNLRLPKSVDYWWDIIMGGLLTSMFLISVGGLVLMKSLSKIKKNSLNLYFSNKNNNDSD